MGGINPGLVVYGSDLLKAEKPLLEMKTLSLGGHFLFSISLVIHVFPSFLISFYQQFSFFLKPKTYK